MFSCFTACPHLQPQCVLQITFPSPPTHLCPFGYLQSTTITHSCAMKASWRATNASAHFVSSRRKKIAKVNWGPGKRDLVECKMVQKTDMEEDKWKVGMGSGDKGSEAGEASGPHLITAQSLPNNCNWDCQNCHR